MLIHFCGWVFFDLLPFSNSKKINLTVKKLLFYVACALLMPSVLYSQEIIQFKVLDSADQSPLFGATVQVEALQMGAITDI